MGHSIEQSMLTAETVSYTHLAFNFMLEYFSQHQKELTLLYQRVLPVNLFDQMLTCYSEALLKEITQIFPNAVRQQKLSRYFSRIIASNILTSIRWCIWKVLRLPGRRWRKLSA